MALEVWFRGTGGRYSPVHWKGTALLAVGMGCAALGVVGHGLFEATAPVLAGYSIGFVVASIITTIIVAMLHSAPNVG
jgi:hypothetical protein